MHTPVLLATHRVLSPPLYVNACPSLHLLSLVWTHAILYPEFVDPSALDVGCWQWVFGWKVGLTALLPADCKIYIWTVEQLVRWGRMDRSDRQQERKSIIAVRYWWKALWGSLSQCELPWSDLSCLGRETGHERGSEQRRGCVAVKPTEVNFYQIVPSGI